MNAVLLVGRIAGAIDLKEFRAGTTDAKYKARFLLAVPRFEKDAEPNWVRVETWGKNAVNLARFTGRGHRIGVAGRIRSEFYTPPGGTKELRSVVVAEQVQFLGAPRTSAVQEAPAPSGDAGKARR